MEGKRSGSSVVLMNIRQKFKTKIKNHEVLLANLSGRKKNEVI